MIKIQNKEKCCGCEACSNICPKDCIGFREDSEGFRYPMVNTEICVDCGLCEKACPCLNPHPERKPRLTFAAVNPDESVRMTSSSGGIFSMLADAVIESGGAVAGAVYGENLEVRHVLISDRKDLPGLRGSKYSQSIIGHLFREIKRELTSGRRVLFCGTPCEVAGLRGYLRMEFPNLVTVDFVCHSVPSPLVWRRYLDELNPEGSRITRVNLRDKSRGWARYSYRIETESGTLYDDYAANSPYLQGFNKNLTTRPSCFDCPVKGGRSGSDLTLADNWGWEMTTPDITDNKGISAVLANTDKGEALFNSIKAEKRLISFDKFRHHNPAYSEKAKRPKGRKIFWELFPSVGLAAVRPAIESFPPTLLERILSKFPKFR